MRIHKKSIPDLLTRTNGILKLHPTFVHRFYLDLDRLGQNRLKLRSRVARNIPERWVASSVEAVNAPPLPAGGLSWIEIKDESVGPISLRDAIRAAPQFMLGEA